MKKSIFIFLMIPIFAFAQKPEISPLQWNEDQIHHQTVLDFPSIKSDQLFPLTKLFLNDLFKNYSEVVNIEDQGLGIISGRGITQSSYSGFVSDTWDIHFSFKYEIKDEKIRVTFENFEFLNPQGRMTSFESLTRNALNGKYIARLTKPQREIFQNLGLKFESFNAELVKKAGQSDDW